MKKLLLRLSIVVTVLALGAVAAELIVRAADPFGISYYRDVHRYQHEAIRLTSPNPLEPADTDRLFQNLPRVDMQLETFRFCTDELGLRSEEPGGFPEGEGMRILCLGDSTTLGWGVEDRDTWVRLLQRGARAADGRPLLCFNAGHLMYDSAQEADLLGHLGPLLAPELVLLMFNTNDLTPTLDLYQTMVEALVSAELPTGLGKLQAGLERRFMSTFRGLRNLMRYRREVDTLGRAERHDFTLDDIPNYPGGWPRVAASLERIRVACEALGCKLVILDHADPPVPDLIPWCEEQSVLRIDGTWTDEEWKRDIRNSPADPHANAEGNRLIAQKAARGLRALGLLAPAESADELR